MLSDFARLVRKYDPYVELELTWWLIHYHIASDENEATSWYYLFNLLPVMEFNGVFVNELDKYCAKVINKRLPGVHSIETMIASWQLTCRPMAGHA